MTLTSTLNGLRAYQTLELYALTLRLQSQLYAEANRAFLKNLTQWQKASRVLDIGCGPGAFVQSIEDLLAGKSYVGIDIEHDFIKEASALSTQNRKFVCKDFFEFQDKPFDSVVMWAVLQHLPDTEKALIHMRKLLAKGGVALIFDGGEGDELQASPDLPILRAMYRELSDENTKGKRKDRCLAEAESLAEKLGLKVIKTLNSNLPIKTDENKVSFIQYSLQASELVRRFYQSNVDQEKLADELQDWRDSQNSVALLTGGRWVVLQKA